jgi:NF-kappa-B inhibitor-interacting Ras-like protein
MGKTSKVIVCGMKGVGKTAILEQLIVGNVQRSTEFSPTIEDIYAANIETDRGTKEKLYFYDTAGSLPPSVEGSPISNFQGIPKHYMAFADGYVLVYDTRKPESLNLLMLLQKDIERSKEKKEVSAMTIFIPPLLSSVNFQTTIVILGNTTGPPDPGLQENTVTKASNWCTREKLRHFEVCAMERTSLYEAFIHLSTKLNPAPTKSSFPQLPALTKLTQKGIRADS